MTNALSGVSLPEPLAARVRAEIQPGETLLWTGRPDAGILARRSLLLTVFGIFFLVGGYLVLSPVWAGRSAQRTAYALTNRRVIVCSQSLFSLAVQSFTADQLGRMYRKERPDGTGDLIFYESAWQDSEGHRNVRAVGFHALPNVKGVEDLIRASL